MKKINFLFPLIGLLIFSACKNNNAPKTVTVETSCAKIIEKNLNQTKGIKEAKVDFETKKATLIFDANILSAKEVKQVVLNTGKAYTVKDFQLLD